MVFIPLKAELKDFLKDYEKLIILGIGNELRGDDGLGSYFIKELELDLDKDFDTLNGSHNQYKLDDNLILIDCGSVPENFTGMIKKEKPSHILAVDAALMGSSPGTVKVIKKEKIADINTSSHSMSLSFLIKYLEEDITFKFLFIGVEPVAMDLGENLSEEVMKSGIFLKNTLISVLNDNE